MLECTYNVKIISATLKTRYRHGYGYECIGYLYIFGQKSKYQNFTFLQFTRVTLNELENILKAQYINTILN